MLAGGAALGGMLVLAGCGKTAGDGGSLRASVVGKGEADTQLLLRAAGLKPQGFTVDYTDIVITDRRKIVALWLANRVCI